MKYALRTILMAVITMALSGCDGSTAAGSAASEPGSGASGNLSIDFIKQDAHIILDGDADGSPLKRIFNADGDLVEGAITRSLEFADSCTSRKDGCRNFERKVLIYGSEKILVVGTTEYRFKSIAERRRATQKISDTFAELHGKPIRTEADVVEAGSSYKSETRMMKFTFENEHKYTGTPVPELTLLSHQSVSREDPVVYFLESIESHH